MKNIKYFTMLIGAGSAIFSGAFAGAMIDGHMLRGPIQIKNSAFESDILSFAKISAMAELAEEITGQISVSFVLGNLSVDPSPEKSGPGHVFSRAPYTLRRERRDQLHDCRVRAYSRHP